MACREDVLGDFAMEEEISAQILISYLERYPIYTEDLLALFNELTLTDLELEQEPLEQEIGQSDAELTRLQRVETALYGQGARELSKQLSLPRTFLMGLQANMIHLGTLPAAFLKNLADAIDVRMHDVVNAMQRGDGQSYAFKSDGKPKIDKAIPFESYVENAKLTETEKNALKRLIISDGSD